eukprot:scaffold80198_cov73-Phaeocystis_antarctica.AAC.3
MDWRCRFSSSIDGASSLCFVQDAPIRTAALTSGTQYNTSNETRNQGPTEGNAVTDTEQVCRTRVESRWNAPTALERETLSLRYPAVPPVRTATTFHRELHAGTCLRATSYCSRLGLPPPLVFGRPATRR